VSQSPSSGLPAEGRELVELAVAKGRVRRHPRRGAEDSLTSFRDKQATETRLLAAYHS
jgi:hypothetical protein